MLLKILKLLIDFSFTCLIQLQLRIGQTRSLSDLILISGQSGKRGKLRCPRHQGHLRMHFGHMMWEIKDVGVFLRSLHALCPPT